MKILKKADAADWSYKTTCSECQSELEVESFDLVRTYYPGDYRDPAYESFTSTCPVCNNCFTVPVNKIPKIVQLKAKTK